MVMGQEERKNKAKLEKTQIQLSTTSAEYEAAVKVLEETTGRWNRDWKAACDVRLKLLVCSLKANSRDFRNSKISRKSESITQKTVFGPSRTLHPQSA